MVLDRRKCDTRLKNGGTWPPADTDRNAHAGGMPNYIRRLLFALDRNLATGLVPIPLQHQRHNTLGICGAAEEALP